MNKFLLLLAACSFTVAAASAQTTTAPAKPKDHHEHAAKAAKTPEQRAEHMTQRLTKTVQLTPTQQKQVYQLFLTQAQQKQADRAQQPMASATDKAARHAQMKAKRAEYDAQLKQILSAEQYTKYAQVRAEHKAKHKDGLGHGKMKAKG